MKKKFLAFLLILFPIFSLGIAKIGNKISKNARNFC